MRAACPAGAPAGTGVATESRRVECAGGGDKCGRLAMGRGMIRYTLRCAADHQFESWFQSAAAFDRLEAAGRLTCPMCGGHEVQKALMAPAVHPGRRPEGEGEVAPAPLSTPASALEAAIAALRRHVEETSEYVGVNFVSEVRKMHAGTAPERSVWGEARVDEARALVEEGFPVAPLPFRPARKTS